MEAHRLLERFVFGKSGERKALPVALDNFPAWISRTVQIYAFNLAKNHSVYLVRPLKELEFDQLTNILAQVESKLGGPALLVADDVNPKYRPLFVKNNVPFVYKEKTIFAPKLGLKLLNYRETKPQKTRQLEEAISPFELKLLAGYLTAFIMREGFNLSQLEFILEGYKFKCSKAKLAQAINHLIELDFVDTKGAGPNRLVTFKNRQEIWDRLKKQPLKPFSKTIESYYMTNADYIFSGETALAHYSDLAEPKMRYLAMTNQQFKQIQKSGDPVGDFGKPQFVCDVLKESPRLFAKDDGFLNPVELYFLLRAHSDERVQIALEQMITNLGIKA
ncbi:MAG: hypothetical protein HYV97_05125 [Bdellovibrio sp.]|nr:hypothetical protein [Bdellovibrio sp.]